MKRHLTDLAIKHLKPIANNKKYADGGGLYLLVTPTGGKYWRYNYTYPKGGRQKTLSIGAYPEISLSEARKRHESARHLLAQDIDPNQHKRMMQHAKLEAHHNTFEAVATEWFIKFTANLTEGYKQRLFRRLEKNVFIHIGNMPIAELRSLDILHCLNKITARGALETAHRTKQTIGKIMRYAAATGRAERDITTDLKEALPPHKTQHLAAITKPEELGHLLLGLDNYQGDYETLCALRFAPLVFVRPQELRLMQWHEINWDAQRWEIPAEKMKMRQPHIVPLATQAINILTSIQPHTCKREYVFASHREPRRPLSNNTLTQALRRLGYSKEQMTIHGFRATARTLLDEALEFPPHIIDQQLAHAVKDPNGRAYNRTKHLPQRTDMMQRWADYLDELRLN